VIVLISVTGGLLIGAIAVVTDYFRQRARDEMDATIKMEMLERGMTAEDIVKVLKAGSVSYDAASWGSEEGKHHCRQSRRAMRRAMREAARNHGHA
jgi:hypothetical protein